MLRFAFRSLPLLALILVAGCGCHRSGEEALSPSGARVAVARQAPTVDCHPLAYLVGESRAGRWSGHSKAKVVEGAVTDLRNKAGNAGANYVQSDSPQWAGRNAATVSGTAYRCDAEPTIR